MRKSICCFLTVMFMVLLPCGIFAADSGDGDTIWVVKFRSDISLSSASRFADAQGEDAATGEDALVPLSQEDSRYFTTTDAAVAAELAASGLCEYVEETGVSYATAAPNDPLYAKTSSSALDYEYQYALEMLNAASAWEKTTGSSSVNVVVIDSGFTYSHEDGANIKAGYDYITESTNTKDYDSHGTVCAGIIGATYNNNLGIAGAAPDCNITMLRCFQKRNGQLSANNAHIAAAIRDAVDKYDADVISMSFGSGVNDEVLSEAVDYAYSKGVIMLAATGNYGHKGSPLEYPAAYNKVIGVGAVDSTKTLAYYSTKNTSTYVTAPGSNILSLDSTSDTSYLGQNVSGTSFSTPYVAALAALARSLDEDITSGEFRGLLRATVTDLGNSGYDYSYGYGLVNYGTLITKMTERPFLDVSDGEWYADAIYNLRNAKVVTGETTYTYCPEDSVTRGEFVTLLARLSKQDLSSYNYKGHFSDVSTGDWYNAVINWAYKNKVVEGTSATEFSPELTITREEMATMIYRYCNTMGVAIIDKGGAVSFSDMGSVSSWAGEAVTTLVKAKIIVGFEDNTFRPAATTTRAEAAVLLDRMNNL